MFKFLKRHRRPVVESKKQQRGFTLLEILVVIAVIAILAYYLGPRAKQALAGGNSVNYVQDMDILNTNLSNYYAHQYTGATAANAIAANVVPSNMVQGTALVDPWGGAITFAVVAGNLQYTLTDSSIPGTECARDASGLYASVTSLTVNGTAVTSAVTAATACAAASPAVFVFTNG
jgi:prepilin-type N-terminal cleavage/methylation domain-containing protein